jgi:hypothetical protein
MRYSSGYAQGRMRGTGVRGNEHKTADKCVASPGKERQSGNGLEESQY